MCSEVCLLTTYKTILLLVIPYAMEIHGFAKTPYRDIPPRSLKHSSYLEVPVQGPSIHHFSARLGLLLNESWFPIHCFCSYIENESFHSVKHKDLNVCTYTSLQHFWKCLRILIREWGQCVHYKICWNCLHLASLVIVKMLHLWRNLFFQKNEAGYLRNVRPDVFLAPLGLLFKENPFSIRSVVVQLYRIV